MRTLDFINSRIYAISAISTARDMRHVLTAIQSGDMKRAEMLCQTHILAGDAVTDSYKPADLSLNNLLEGRP